MIKYLILSFLIGFSFSNTNGQVYFLNELESILILGPENVKYEGKEIAKYYSKKYSNIETELDNKIYLTDSIISLYNSKSKLKRPEKSKLRRLKKENEKLNFEKEITNEFKEFWINEVFEDNLLAELFYLDSIGKCVDIETESGNYSHIQYEIEREELNDQIFYKETIPIDMTTTDKDYEWVKKKSGDNCLSADPEDCMIWCKVKVNKKTQNSNVLNYLGEEMHLNQCPTYFSLSLDKKKCERELMYENNENTDYEIKLISKTDRKELKLKSMIVLDCKE